MRRTEEAAFASALRALKERTPHSFETLSARTGISRSALHRYCAGKAIPAEFATVERFAKRCGADRAELVDLHHLWVQATEPGDRAHPAATTPANAEHSANAGGLEPSPPPAARTVARFTSRRRKQGLLGVSLVVLLGALLVVLRVAPWSDDRQLLLSEACEGTIGLGQQDECVREVQRLLAEAGGASADSAVAGRFVTDTRRQVLAYQALAGLRISGIVDGPMRRSLYQDDVSLTTWGKRRVRDRIRAVFTENPGQAVKLADCQSTLDPHYVKSNADSSRTWGLFQLSEARLKALGGTPKRALDPEWSIKAAHRVWSTHKDFSAWPRCLTSFEPIPGSKPEQR